jgi:signal transduction histidine kinase
MLAALDVLSIFNALSGPYLVLSPELIIEAANDAYVAAAGTPRDNLVGRPLRDALPDNIVTAGTPFRQSLLASLAQVLASGQPHTMAPLYYEASALAQAGGVGTRHWQPTNTLLRDAQGQPAYLIHHLLDITAQVEAEAQLRAYEAREAAAQAKAETQHQRVAEMLHQLPAQVATNRGPELVYELVNPRYQALFPTRTIQGLPIQQALPELIGQGILERLVHVYQTGEPYYNYEQEAWVDVTDTGKLERRYFSVFYQALHDTHGNIEGVLNFSYDITEQVVARQQTQALNETLQATNQELRQSNALLITTQHELQQLNQELELRVAERTQQLEDLLREAQQQRQQLGEQQQLLRQILSLVPAAVATFSGPEHRLTFFNDTYQAMVVKPVALATPAAVLFSEEVEKGFLTLLDEVYTTGQPVVGNEIMARYLAVSTTPRYLDFTYQALLGPDGRPNGVLASVIDVTEKVLARQQVQQLNEELRATNKELHLSNLALSTTNQQLTRTNVDLDNFIYTASHDLKSPISNIEGLLLALQHELPAEAQTGDVSVMMDLMQDAIERFKRTIAHLTDVTRLQKEYSQEASQVPLAALVAEVRLDLTPLIRQTGGQLEVLVPESATLTFSEKNLRSVVYNLLSNAFKYRHPERPPHVRVTYRTQETYQVLEVQDNGLGLDLAQGQAKLFAMFQRLHTHVEGSGIGLYMVKRIVENVGGHIEVASTIGEGCTFSVYFPY